MSGLLAGLWKALDAITSPVTVLVLLALSAALLAGGVERHWRLQAERGAHAATRTELLQARAAFAEARADASEKARLVGAQYRAIEARMQLDKETAEARHAERVKAAETRAAVLARDNRELRQLADGYARGAGGAAGSAADSVAACHQRAAELGQLFADADRVAGEMAAAADRHADEVRLLLEAWPAPAAAAP